MPAPGEDYSCELCADPISGEFGDVNGAIVCPKCMGWTGQDPDPFAQKFLEKHGEGKKKEDKVAKWPPEPMVPRSSLLGSSMVIPLRQPTAAGSRVAASVRESFQTVQQKMKELDEAIKALKNQIDRNWPG